MGGGGRGHPKKSVAGRWFGRKHTRAILPRSSLCPGTSTRHAATSSKAPACHSSIEEKKREGKGTVQQNPISPSAWGPSKLYLLSSQTEPLSLKPEGHPMFQSIKLASLSMPSRPCQVSLPCPPPQLTSPHSPLTHHAPTTLASFQAQQALLSGLCTSCFPLPGPFHCQTPLPRLRIRSACPPLLRAASPDLQSNGGPTVILSCIIQFSSLGCYHIL